MQNSDENTEVSTNICFTKIKISILRDTGNNTIHMDFEGELADILHTKDVEVGTSSDRNPRQDQVSMGRATD